MEKKKILQESIKRFNIWSNRYDGSILQYILFHPTHRSLDKILKQYFRDGKNLLDIACGTGQFAIRIKKKNPNMNIYGVDSSPGMIKQAEAKCRSIAWTLCPAEKLWHNDGGFDIVTCSHAFHHFPNKDKAIAEMYRVLKPGGVLIIADGQKRNLWGWLIFNVVELIEGKVHHTNKEERIKLLEKYHFIYSHMEVNHLVPTLISIGIKA